MQKHTRLREFNALDDSGPIAEACAGLWVAHGAGAADRLVTGGHDRLTVPPANPWCRLRQAWHEALADRAWRHLTRWPHRASETRIRLPPMSSAWLRVTEVERRKHGPG